MTDVTCPVCASEARQSTVFDHGWFVTLLSCDPFYDDSGRRHVHDLNRVTTGILVLKRPPVQAGLLHPLQDVRVDSWRR